jgi:ADP-heptose:LPS heptosyltransferase
VEVPYKAERTAAYLAAARARPYDLVLQMHGDGNRSNGFVADLSAAVSLGYRRGDDDRLTATLPYDPDEHQVLRWLRLVALIGAPVDDTSLDCPTTTSDRARAAALLTDINAARPLVGLHPGAKDPTRRWPAERFAALGDALMERLGAQVVLTGGAGERPVTAAVRQAMRGPALDLAGETGLGAFAAVVDRLDLLVTNDTGAWHLAVAMGTPSVAVIGPGQPDGWEPLDRRRHRVVDARKMAAPGMDAATALRQLPVAPVIAVCLESLRDSAAASRRRQPAGASPASFED